jgi:hypothetical protein
MIRQTMVAYAAYSGDSKDGLLPGYLRGSWADPVKRRFIVPLSPTDSSEAGRLSGSVIRPYTWRLRPYLGYSDAALVADRNFLSSLNDLPRDPGNRAGYERVLARHPAFGLNSTFVGGDAHRGGYYLPSFLRWGPFYVTRMDQPISTDKLLVFASAACGLLDFAALEVPATYLGPAIVGGLFLGRWLLAHVSQRWFDGLILGFAAVVALWRIGFWTCAA